MRCAVAVGVQSVRETRLWVKMLASQIMKFGVKIGKVLSVGNCFWLAPVNLAQSLRVVKSDFGLRGLARIGRVPGPAVRTAETRATRSRVSKGSVDDVVVGNAKNEFVHADSGQEIRFSGDAIVGGALQLQQVVELGMRKRQAREHALGIIGISRRDEPVGIVARNRGKARLTLRSGTLDFRLEVAAGDALPQSLQSSAPRVQQLANMKHCRHAAL